MSEAAHRQITMILHIERRRVSGRWQDEESHEQHTICIDGESTQIPWSSTLVERIINNYQIDTAHKSIRIVLCCDQPLKQEEIPVLQTNGEWTLQELSDLVRPQTGSASKWFLHDVDLQGSYVKLFPVTSHRTGKPYYLYTCPEMKPPERPKPPAPLFEIMQSLDNR